jgi:hypothetical protein
MVSKLVYIVIPQHWDTLMGDIVVFSTPEKARAYAMKEGKKQPNIAFNIRARYIDLPKKRKVVTQCKSCGKEWEESF